MKRICKELMEAYEKLNRLRADKEGLDQKYLSTESIYRIQIRERKGGDSETTSLK